MSDFDKEAEREKLREQFAEEEKDRESTRRMSELLLKGATMTNKHCDACGDPIFRYEGQEFCPSCQAAGQAAAHGDATEHPDPDSRAATPDADADVGADAQADAEAQANGGGTTERDAVATGRTDRQAAPPVQDDRHTPPSQSGGPTGREDADGRVADSVDAQDRRQTADRSARQTRPAEGSVARDGEFGDAEAAIVATIRRFSDAAANTDDPTRAREYLKTVREARNALDALRR